MPCFHPLEAYRNDTGVRLGKETRDSERLRLPCGGCLGCRASTAAAWALRCHLELNDHEHAAFVTLTYDDDHLPNTLDKQHVSTWLRRLRRRSERRLRFFAAGEYGERTLRPHYHALVYGLDANRADDLEQLRLSWTQGFTQAAPITPQRIAYTAGYCQKKIGWRANSIEERVNYETGEVYTWQPPFRLMSRNPGIGASARQFTSAWRDYAIANGQKIPVPRYLHEAWKETATDDELAELAMQRAQEAIHKDTSTARIKAAEQIAVARQRIRAESRH